jgi:hypothetical protein
MQGGERIGESSWYKFNDEEGTAFYANAATQQSQWDAPSAVCDATVVVSLINLSVDLQKCILQFLPSISLQFAGRSCKALQSQSKDQSLWQSLCHSQWPCTRGVTLRDYYGYYKKCTPKIDKADVMVMFTLRRNISGREVQKKCTLSAAVPMAQMGAGGLVLCDAWTSGLEELWCADAEMVTFPSQTFSAGKGPRTWSDKAYTCTPRAERTKKWLLDVTLLNTKTEAVLHLMKSKAPCENDSYDKDCYTHRHAGFADNDKALSVYHVEYSDRENDFGGFSSYQFSYVVEVDVRPQQPVELKFYVCTLHAQDEECDHFSGLVDFNVESPNKVLQRLALKQWRQ